MVIVVEAIDGEKSSWELWGSREGRRQNSAMVERVVGTIDVRDDGGGGIFNMLPDLTEFLCMCSKTEDCCLTHTNSYCRL
jgi:hypothetical protein